MGRGRTADPRRVHPRAALLGFASAVLAYNVLALLERCLERAHAAPDTPPLSVSLFHLAQAIRSGYDGLAITLDPTDEAWTRPRDPTALATQLIALEPISVGGERWCPTFLG